MAEGGGNALAEKPLAETPWRKRHWRNWSYTIFKHIEKYSSSHMLLHICVLQGSSTALVQFHGTVLRVFFPALIQFSPFFGFPTFSA